ncbi:MAG TPA: ribonuclease III [Anaerolineales bacterium]|nr:ribonuclease III [Anaerolineales bacterium]
MDISQGSHIEELPEAFARRVGLSFDNIGLLTRALTHRSYMNEHRDALEDNERLEFLGDAVLDFLVGAWLYNRFPEMAEGYLTRMRAALVGNQQLAEFARQIHLGRAMRLGRGEADGGGRDRLALLGSTFEAVIAAIYLDQGIPTVRVFVEPLLEMAVQQILSARRDHDPKSLLQEWSQGQGYGPPLYKTVSDSGPDHDKSFDVEVIVNGKVYGRGSGHSKQAATKDAARQALDAVELSEDAGTTEIT